MVILIFLFFADSLLKEGDYFNAITEYKRILFFKEYKEKYIYFNIGKCYEKLKDFQKSALYYGKYYLLKDNISDSFLLRYSYILFKIGKFEEGIFLLKRIKENNNIRNLLLFYGYLKINKESEFLKTSLSKNYHKTKKIFTFLSFVLPGIPIIFTGHVTEGITSFLINLGTGYMVYKSFKEKDYLGITLNFSLFWRFYTGNINATKSFLKRKTEKEIEEKIKYFLKF